jgi:tetratricopeptide (TPR) repeat protein
LTGTELTSQPDAQAPADSLEQAKALIQGTRFGEAAALLHSLLETPLSRTDEVEVLYLLAVAQRYTRQYRHALQSLDVLLTKDAGYARAYQELGHTHLAMNEPGPARSAYSRAVELNPALPASWRVLAGLHDRAGHRREGARARQRLAFLESLPTELVSAYSFLYQKKLRKAERLCRDFLQRNKHHVEAMRLLAMIGVRMQIYDDAEFLLESCVELYPENIPARVEYLNLLLSLQRFDKAREQAQILLQENPDDPGYQVNMAAALEGLGQSEEAITRYRQVLKKDPHSAQRHLLLGHALKTTGAIDQAIEAYRSAYRIRPQFGDAYWSLANTKTYEFTDSELAQIVEHEQSADTPEQDRIHLCFAAGKAYEDRKEYDTSFAYYERGNALNQQQTRYKDANFQSRVEAQMEACTAELFAQRQGVGNEAPDPIFIVGLPRSGSTLLEQILASHSMVDGTMELHNIVSLARRLRGRAAKRSPRYPAILRDLEDDQFRRFGEQYIDNTRAYRAGAPYFIDKMPNNFRHIGLIRLILPNSKVIDARRHPMACCFSGFKQLFGKGQEFTYGLYEIGRYYHGYVRLMDHWDRVLPGFVLRVMHKDVVDDLEGQVRRVLDFCGLPFEESCIRFHETQRNIRTPSSEQVKQPIYRSALEHWRNYEEHLQPLRDALGPEILSRYPD